MTTDRVTPHLISSHPSGHLPGKSVNSRQRLDMNVPRITARCEFHRFRHRLGGPYIYTYTEIITQDFSMYHIVYIALAGMLSITVPRSQRTHAFISN